MTDQPADSTLTTEAIEKQKLRINWFSNAPWANTGYGCQTRLNAPRIAKLGYPLSITAFYGLEGGRIYFDGIPVYSRFMHPYGQDIIGGHAEHFGANAIITLMDAWVVTGDMAGINWYPWYPIDHEPMTSMVFEKLRKAKKGIVMSKFGKAQAEKMGLDSYYVPHCVDTKVFKPSAMNEARDRLGFSKDKFIVGMVAANKGNPSRKAFLEQIAAFKAFHTVHPESMLYLHTITGAGGGDCVNLKKYCEVMQLKSGYVDCRPLDNSIEVAFVDQYQNAIGIPDPYMVDVYNACDVTMLASMGEGFGIPLLESQSCGCPVITGDWTSMSELCFSGWKIDKSEATPTFTSFESFQWQVRVEAVVNRLFSAYEVKDNIQYRSRARDGAVKYDADRVLERFWKPVLADMEANL